MVELSGEADPTNLVGGIPLDDDDAAAAAVVKELALPTMFVVATKVTVFIAGHTRG